MVCPPGNAENVSLQGATGIFQQKATTLKNEV